MGPATDKHQTPKSHLKTFNFVIMCATLLWTSSCADREGGGRGSGPSLKNHKNRGLLSNTVPDPLKNHKASKSAFNVGPSSAFNGVSLADR